MFPEIGIAHESRIVLKKMPYLTWPKTGWSFAWNAARGLAVHIAAGGSYLPRPSSVSELIPDFDVILGCSHERIRRGPCQLHLHFTGAARHTLKVPPATLPSSPLARSTSRIAVC